jgi:hypothetical protein
MAVKHHVHLAVWLDRQQITRESFPVEISKFIDMGKT